MTSRPSTTDDSAPASAGASPPGPSQTSPLLDLVIAGVSLAMGVALVIHAQDYRAMIPRTVIGPGLLLTICGVVFTGLGVTMGLGAVRRLPVGAPRGAAPQSLRFALLVPALLVAALAATPAIGFLPAAALSAFVLMKASGARWLPALGATLVLGAAVHLAFAEVMRVPLPAGSLF
ncbi:tripartite tricarboxylate transporter TctB family protein [Stappia sp. ICDLI1TA098]|jgi:hypothetical protein